MNPLFGTFDCGLESAAQTVAHSQPALPKIPASRVLRYQFNVLAWLDSLARMHTGRAGPKTGVYKRAKKFADKTSASLAGYTASELRAAFAEATQHWASGDMPKCRAAVKALAVQVGRAVRAAGKAYHVMAIANRYELAFDKLASFVSKQLMGCEEEAEDDLEQARWHLGRQSVEILAAIWEVDGFSLESM